MSNYFSLGFNAQDIMNAAYVANMQAAMNTATSAYMSGSIFNSGMPSLPAMNVDMNTSLSTPAWLQNVGTVTPQFDFSGMDFTANPFTQGGATYGVITDEDGQKLTETEYAEKHGYEETYTDGVYKKGDKYYRYNAALKRFAQISKAELTAIEQAERDAENKKKAAAYKEKLASSKDERVSKAKGIAKDIYDAMKGWGTNDTKLANSVSKINKDNVLEVWELWNSNHEADFGNEGGLMASIADDTSGSDLRKYEIAIKEALIARAEALGLTADADQFRAHDNKDYSSYATIVEAIRLKERE